MEKVVPARNSMSSIDWCKNFHDSKQHDDFYKTQTDRQTNFLRIIIFGSVKNQSIEIDYLIGFFFVEIIEVFVSKIKFREEYHKFFKK